MNLVNITHNGSVGTITLNRPEKRNALDLAMRGAIAEAVSDLSTDDDILAIVITGGNEVFAAGADLNLLVDKGAQEVSALNLAQYWAPLKHCPKPVIAAVSGFALGAGCELAMMCDIIVADSSARFGQPEAGVGIMPGAGGTQRLIRTVGKYVASQLLMGGGQLTGERAFQLGLVSEFVDESCVIESAEKMAVRIARMPPLAIQAIKRSLTDASDLPLDAALALENREFLLLFDTDDKKEGMQAFLEKRRPQFKGC